MHVCMRVYTCACTVLTLSHTRTHIGGYGGGEALTHNHIQTHVHTHQYTHTHTHTHAHAHAHAHAHEHMLLRQQKSTGVLETNSLTIMPELPLLLLPHIPPWHILFLAQSNCVLRGRITATSVTVPRQRRSVMVRSRRMMLLLRQPKYTSVLESNSPPLMPAMLLLLSPHIRLQQY